MLELPKPIDAAGRAIQPELAAATADGRPAPLDIIPDTQIEDGDEIVYEDKPWPAPAGDTPTVLARGWS